MGKINQIARLILRNAEVFSLAAGALVSLPGYDLTTERQLTPAASQGLHKRLLHYLPAPFPVSAFHHS
jgi:hypothetical protein